MQDWSKPFSKKSAIIILAVILSILLLLTLLSTCTIGSTTSTTGGMGPWGYFMRGADDAFKVEEDGKTVDPRQQNGRDNAAPVNADPQNY